MKRVSINKRISLSILLCLGLVFIAHAQQVTKPQRLIVFMLDGFGVDYYKASSMPTLNKIEKEGFYKEVKSLMPTVTNTNNASISTGLFPNEHGITGNSFFNAKTNKESFMEDSTLLLAPNIFERAKKFGIKSMMFSSKKKSISLLSKGTELALSPETASNEWIQILGKPPEIYSREVNYWLMEAVLYNINHHPEIGCFYIHTTDYPMHTWAPEENESQQHLKKIDEYISKIMIAAPDVAILISADHSVHHKNLCWDLAKACSNKKVPVRLAISAEKDKYPKHHRGFGGTSYIYLNKQEDLENVKSVLKTLSGVEKVLTRSEAAEQFKLKPERIGDLVVLGDVLTVFGDLETESENLPSNYRSHGSEYETSVPLFIHNASAIPSPDYFIFNFNLTSWLFRNSSR